MDKTRVINIFNRALLILRPAVLLNQLIMLDKKLTRLYLIMVEMLFFFPFILSLSEAEAQNRVLQPLDTTIFSNWQRITSRKPVISKNGNFVWYTISSSSISYTHEKIVIKSLYDNWKDTVLNGYYADVKFSDDSRFAVIYNGLDGHLYIEPLGGKRTLIVNDAVGFELTTIAKKQFLIYRTQNKQLVAYDLLTNKNISFMEEDQYKLVPGGVMYVVKKDYDKFSLVRCDLSIGKNSTIWQGTDPIGNIAVRESNSDIAFSDKSGNYYLYAQSTDKLHKLDIKLGDDCKGLSIAGIERFEADGKLLILKLQVADFPEANPSINPVKIFSYQDPIGYGGMLQGGRIPPVYLAAYNFKEKILTRLEQENEHLKSISADGNSAYIVNNYPNQPDYYWNQLALGNGYVFNLVTKRKIVVHKKYPYGEGKMTQDGLHVVLQDDEGGDLYSVNILKGVKINLTSDLPIPNHDCGSEEPQFKNSRSIELYNLSKDGKSALIYDRYDIWKLDLDGLKAPINLTGGEGRKKHNVFRFIEKDLWPQFRETFILSAFNQDTKNNGFYKLTIDESSKLEKLFMGRYAFQTLILGKSKYKNRSLICRQSAEESLNLFWTRDFKIFHPISNIHPEKKYQWFTTELIDYTTKDGLKSKAILYKPKNIDSNKKYPVLFNYYQNEASDQLNQYLLPGYTSDGFGFNYPMMLSRGYLICVPDVHQQTVGETAHCVVDAVEGAADELAKRSYIDSLHYGLCGGSFGGYVTACLASMSHRFAAAVPISAPTDLVSMYGNSVGLGEWHTENGQMGMGCSLGTDPIRYLHNSPIAYTKKMTTPVLIVNTLWDGNVNVQQSVEWFISLRHDGKRAWMLQYQEKGHGVHELSNERDLYTRMNQFFDHYLKGAPAPIWMTRGISLNDRGVKNGFDYDKDVKTPKPSKLLLDTTIITNNLKTKL